MLKRTDELDFELSNANSIHTFIADNQAEFDDKNFYKLLNTVIKDSGKSKCRVAADCCISEPYMYNLVKGEKRPARDTVIKLSLGLHLPIETAERLLNLAGHSGFYARGKRDAILKFSLASGHGITETEGLLVKYGFSLMKDIG